MNTRREVRNIACRYLLPNHANYRSAVDPVHKAELVASIKQGGVHVPLAVRPSGQEMFRIIAGDTRFMAAQEAGIEELPCLIYEDELSEVDELAISLAENLLRRNPNALDTARAFDRLMKLSGMPASKIADQYGFSTASISRYVALLRLDADTQARIASGDLSPRQGYALACKPRKKSTSKRKHFTARMASGVLSIVTDPKADYDALISLIDLFRERLVAGKAKGHTLDKLLRLISLEG